MNDSALKAIADHGLEILKRCVLEVLYTRRHTDFGYNQIHDTLGIKRIEKIPPDLPKRKDNLVHSILMRLHEGKFAEYTGHNSWKITEAGICFIEGIKRSG